jgi:hypothetical protein
MAKEMTEAQMVGLVRNALVVAGHEMGEDGDHWPVINATVDSIMNDWEEAKIQRDVDAELKTHLYRQLEIMENDLPNCDAELRAELAPRLKDLRELYDSYFSPLDAAAAEPIREDEMPAYIKRAETIIATLGGDHE